MQNSRVPVKIKIMSINTGRICQPRREIALRIMRTAREMRSQNGSSFEADQHRILYADEAYIGLSPSKDSYLLGDKIIEVAKLSAADVFILATVLSRKCEFSEAVTNAGFDFIGQHRRNIRTMGDKISINKP
jgi:acetyl/propionyl-CoA carboxylase alpha subunit